MSTYKLLSWNVNGLRAVMKKNFMDWFNGQNADMVCLQETKLQYDQVPEELLKPLNYSAYYNSAERKGYSGVALFTKPEPQRVMMSWGDERLDNEGRHIIADFPEFRLYDIYFPNGQKGHERIAYKLAYYDSLFAHIKEQRQLGKKIIITGDINTAHTEIELGCTKENERNSGFLPEERAWLDKLVAHGYVDTFRMFQSEGGHYSYWDQRFFARDRNIGWRIDYFFISDDLKPHVKEAFIQSEVLGSDHCP